MHYFLLDNYQKKIQNMRIWEYKDFKKFLQETKIFKIQINKDIFYMSLWINNAKIIFFGFSGQILQLCASFKTQNYLNISSLCQDFQQLMQYTFAYIITLDLQLLYNW